MNNNNLDSITIIIVKEAKIGSIKHYHKREGDSTYKIC